MNDINRHASMTVYSDPACPFSHRTRLVIREKAIAANIVNVINGEWPEDIIAINPSGISPTLVDRDVSLFNSTIIISYLEERFLQPSLMPTSPADRAKMRLMLHQIDVDWYDHINALTGITKHNASKAQQRLKEDLIVLAPMFSRQPFFMNDEFSLLDCSLAPLLWRLPQFKIKLPPQAKSVEDYAERIFARESFQNSLSDIERAMR